MFPMIHRNSSSKLQACPRDFIAAEIDEVLRQLAAAHTGLKLDGQSTKLDDGLSSTATML